MNLTKEMQFYTTTNPALCNTHKRLKYKGFFIQNQINIQIFQQELSLTSDRQNSMCFDFCPIAEGKFCFRFFFASSS